MIHSNNVDRWISSRVCENARNSRVRLPLISCQQDPLRWQACIGSNVILCMIVFIVNVALIFCVSLIIVAYVNIKLGPRDDTTRRK